MSYYPEATTIITQAQVMDPALILAEVVPAPQVLM
jgi:hypothetical protein